MARPRAAEAQDGGIAWKELLPIVLACASLGRQWRGGVVTIHCGNTAAVAVVNSGYSRVPETMHLLRYLFKDKDNLHLFYPQMLATRDRRTSIRGALKALLAEQQPDWTSPAWAQLFRSYFRPR